MNIELPSISATIRSGSEPGATCEVRLVRAFGVRQRLASWFGSALLIALTATSAMAQAVGLGDPGQALTQYRINVWQTEQGLPLNTVQSLLQTRDGYLWVGTGGGLTRFDGVRFTTFESSEVPFVASTPIFSLMEDREGTLWIGHSEGAVVHRDGRFETVFGREVTAGKRVWGFAEADDGTVWIATANGLVSWKNGVNRIYQEKDGLSTRQLRSLAFDREGTLWIGTTGGGLLSFDGEHFEILDESRGFPHDEVRFVLRDPEGGVWAATAGGGLASVHNGQLKTYDVSDGLPTNQLVALTMDPNGSLWIGTWGEGLCRMRDEQFTCISTDGGLAGEQVWSVHADREGSVWVGTWVNGMNRLTDRDFLLLGTPEGLSHDNVRSVTHASDGSAWASTAGGGVNRIHQAQITVITTEDGLPSDETSCIIEDRDGSIWIGTYTGGIARFRAGTIESFGIDSGLPSVDIRVLYQDRNGTLWAGTRWGLARFDGERFLPIENEEAPQGGVSAILEDRSGNLWIGTAGEGLFRYRDGAFVKLTRDDGLVSNWIMALHEDDRGSIWIGTNGEGMNRLRDGVLTAIEPEDGLWDGIIQTLLEDRTGHFWITCNRGFFRVSRDQLDAFAEGRAPSVTSEGYGPGNALRSTTFAGGLQPAGSIDADGNIWLPSWKGLVIVDPEHLPGTEGPPSVHLEEVTVDGVRVSTESTVTLPPGSAPLSIRYTAATLRNADRVQFRYRMDGASGGWVDAGTKREAFFPALPQGDYHFRVAASSDGVHWREAPSSLAITVKPHFFQTRWFLALVILGVLGLTIALVWLWTRHLRRQRKEMARQIEEKTEELREANARLARLSFVDALTGLANRRRLDEALEEEWRRGFRYRTPVGLIVADVDRFKEYNDSLGHVEGDACLVAVAEVLREKARRAGEVVARYGGEEFVILIPGVEREGVMMFAEQLRGECEARAIPHPNSDVAPVVTISLGVAVCVPSKETTKDSLMKKADAALYKAKHEGRNRVCCHEDSETPVS